MHPGAEGSAGRRWMQDKTDHGKRQPMEQRGDMG